MKKTTILTLVTAFLLTGFITNAQQAGDIRVSGGLAVGTKARFDDDGDTTLGLGVNLGAEYLITDVVSLAPSFSGFFKNEIGGADFSTRALNIDARYYFGSDTQLYGLLGFTSVTSKAKGGGLSITNTDSGLNLGVGANLPFGDSLLGNLQAKFQTAADDNDGQIVLNAGVVFGI